MEPTWTRKVESNERNKKVEVEKIVKMVGNCYSTLQFREKRESKYEMSWDEEQGRERE